MEKAILNIQELKVMQGMNGSYSHKGDLAIDIGSACSYFKAPFTGVIKRIYADCNGVWFESLDKVEYADGSIDYMTVMTLHDNDVSNLRVGQIINQGTIYYHPGTKGQVTGSHIHLAVGKGRFTGNGWYRNKKGNWCINNQYTPTKALFIDKNVKQTSPLYQWKQLPVEKTKKSIQVIAKEVIEGKWGNGNERKAKLESAGYNYMDIQNVVNELMNKPDDNQYYVVSKGDTLSSIARKFNISVDKLLKLNSIKNKNLIYINQKLRIK